MELPVQFQGFTDADGRIPRLPVKWSKKVALAEWLLSQLDVERTYSEPELNGVFEKYVDDFALIRRLLVDSGRLERDRYGREYRVVAHSEASQLGA